MLSDRDKAIMRGLFDGMAVGRPITLSSTVDTQSLVDMVAELKRSNEAMVRGMTVVLAALADLQKAVAKSHEPISMTIIHSDGTKSHVLEGT